MGSIPLNLYHISLSSNTWRKVYLMLSDVYGSEVPDPTVRLDKRDLLVRYGIPIEAWIDLRVLDRWFISRIPIPLVSMLSYVLSLQREDGSISVDGIIPNSGATYRAVELALLLGVYDDTRVIKAVDFLLKSLRDGGLPSPGPVEGAVLEVGTTARFLHILTRLNKEKGGSVYVRHIEGMRAFLLSRVCVEGDEAAWHTDLTPEEVGTIRSCITGATSLALYSLCLLGKKEDVDLIRKVCRWLVNQQKEDGGWSDSQDGFSNVDNTFNVVRALKHSEPFLDRHLKDQVASALARSREFLSSINPRDLRTVSLRSMLTRSRLILLEDPLHPEVLGALEGLTDMKDMWYTPKAHLYNEILIAGICIGEWVNSLKEDPYRVAKKSKNRSLVFLFSFPAEIPPFFPGHREGVGERLLNFLTRTGHGQGLVEKLIESITLRDIGSLLISTVLLVGVFLNEDFIKAVILPERTRAVDLYATLFVLVLFSFWLVLKFRFRSNLCHFFTTTTLSVAISFLILWGWLRFSNDLIAEALTSGDLMPVLRLLLTFSLILDIGRRLINVSEIDRILISGGRTR